MFTHLHVHSNFSFLDSGSSVGDLIDRAKELGYKALAITDHNGLYGAVRFYKYARAVGIKPIIGVEMVTEDGYHIVLLAKNINGYSNLCKIITRAHLSHEKGEAAVSLDVLRQYKDDLFCLSGCWKGEVAANLLEGKHDAALEAAMKYTEVFGKEHFLIEIQNHLLPGTSLLNSQLVDVAEQLGLRIVATNNVHYAEKEDFKVQDIMACVRTITTLDDQHELRKKNCEYYLKSPKAMAGLFKRYPEAVKNAGWVADQCDLDLGLGTYRFPDFDVPEGETPYSYLCKFCFEGLEKLYKPITPQATERLQHELKVIHDLGFAEYFLVTWDIVRQAKHMGIRCSGRGSASDSLVAYCLGITIVDPLEHDLLFERFMNPERSKMPDIDIDFDAARRDEIISYIYERFGEDKVAMVCTVNTLCARSSIREIGKAMDFPQDEIGRLAKALPRVSSSRIEEVIEKYPELRDSGIPLWKMETLLSTCKRIDGYPRHLSVHLGGVVISKGLLTDLVPLEWATKGVIVTQFDKDDIEILGLVKMDILGLRNLSAIEGALEMIKETRGIDLDIDNIPLDDSKTFKMIRSTRTVGLYQIESPGMRGLLGRLQPTDFEDIIAVVAMFRPGPMQANMISPFVARRHGEEPVSYDHPCLEPILKETYGVILYQEQVLKIASALAGFSLAQSDSLRRAMTTDRSQEEMEKIKEGFIQGAVNCDVEKKVAEEVFGKLRAFAAYGFCKAHAASCGKISFQTGYLKAHYPAEFLAAILSNEPMGFYPANVIIEEARHFGVGILGVDVNRSGRRYTVETGDMMARWQDGLMAGEPNPLTPFPGKEGGTEPVEFGCASAACSAVQSEATGTMSPSPLVGEGRGEGDTNSPEAPAVTHSSSLIAHSCSISAPSTQHSALLPLTPCIRVSLAQVRGMTEAAMDSIIAARNERLFSSFSDFVLRTRVDRPIIENLIHCGAFDSFGHPRAKLLWLLGEIARKGSGDAANTVSSERSAVSSKDEPLPNPPPQGEGAGSVEPMGNPLLTKEGQGEVLYSALSTKHSALPAQSALFDDLSAVEMDEQLKYLPDVPEPSLHELMRMDYEILGLSPLGHPMIFYREKLAKAGVIKSSQVRKMRDGAFVRIAGVVVVLMRPPTKSGNVVVFVTLEDEDGLVDTVTFLNVYEKYGKIIYNNPALIMEGRIKRMGKRGISVVVSKVSEMGPQYRDDYEADNNQKSRAFKERVRSAGQRSWVKGTGV